MKMLAPLVTAVAALWPSVGLACAVCAGSDESRDAFLGTTIFLSLFPLALIGGGIGWVALQVRNHAR